MFKKTFGAALLAAALTFVAAGAAQAERYMIDNKGNHAFIQFKISHLGFSYIIGRFNKFSGEFEVDEKNPGAGKVAVDIDVASIDTNHAKRDKHLRSSDFLEVDKFPTAKFESTGIKVMDGGKAVVTGNFTLKGVTKPLDLEMTHVGGGKDPWGGVRRGFEGKAKFRPADWGVTYNLGPASETVEIYLSIEGVRM